MASASWKAVSAVARSTQGSSKRLLHGSAVRRAITNLQMPAMSPTMTEGGIASWKMKEGDAFTTGDILLEIETDKATIDVEAQDDGILGKILAPDGTKAIPVGKVIALLAEEGDDISNLEAPKDESSAPAKKEETSTSSNSSSSPSPNSAPLHKSDSQPPQSSESHSHAAPEHSRPLFPSVLRLLAEHKIAKPSEIKGTGVRGMLTKGDVLAYVGQASGPLGTFKFGPSPIEEALAGRTQAGAPGTPSAAPKVALDGPAIRRLIVGSMFQASQKARNPGPVGLKDADFDSVIADYLPQSTPKPSPSSTPAPPAKKAADFLDGLH
ncbi:hypothetical protein D9619_006036 [Psilocybe cf. subviscida]|uniref:Single hybrid motif-containing protein n=1 Tax=Psilocybe cf. subviscida TaxID=2480587 RepID=A0A8H5BZ96_9AGAR|nr:hypothetical protein D9619_006036 [Psilocybe cf. subviscida]